MQSINRDRRLSLERLLYPYLPSRDRPPEFGRLVDLDKRKTPPGDRPPEECGKQIPETGIESEILDTKITINTGPLQHFGEFQLSVVSDLKGRE